MFVISIIAIIVAVALNQANILGPEAAWAMIGAGIGGATFVVGWMTITHLLFMRKVDRLLKNLTSGTAVGLENWQDGANYLGINNIHKTHTPSNTCVYDFEGEIILARRYGISTLTGDRFFCEFYHFITMQEVRGKALHSTNEVKV